MRMSKFFIVLISLLVSSEAADMFWAEDQIEPVNKGKPCNKRFVTSAIFLEDNIILDPKPFQENERKEPASAPYEKFEMEKTRDYPDYKLNLLCHDVNFG